jgi:hypothetical protein
MSFNPQTRRLSQRTREMRPRTSSPGCFKDQVCEKGEAVIEMPPALEFL